MAVIYMDRNSFGAMGDSDIRRIYNDNRSALTKYKQLDDQYIGKHNILDKPQANSNDPNNHIVNNFCKYITDVITGYFIGEPIVYSSFDDDKEFLEKIINVFEFNDEQDENSELAKKSSIHGSCFELLYMDEDANIRFSKVPASQGILIKDASLDDGYLGFIRVLHYLNKDKELNILLEFYTSTEVWRFSGKGEGSLQLDSIDEHYWNDVPVVEFPNNDERLGDFEGIVSINDAYNTVQSNTANLFQYNDEALMKITKLGEVSTDDIKQMRKKGAVILDDGGDVSWLLKEINDTAIENYKNRLIQDMHLFSGVPNMTDSSFGGNLSGVAISYKMWSMDQIVKVKERKFKKGIQRRIELITNIFNLFGSNYDYRDINITFKRNAPQNDLENAQIVNMLQGILSQYSLLSRINGIENPQDEIDRIKEENEDEEVKNGVYSNLVKAFEVTGEDDEQETT